MNEWTEFVSALGALLKKSVSVKVWAIVAFVALAVVAVVVGGWGGIAFLTLESVLIVIAVLATREKGA